MIDLSGKTDVVFQIDGKQAVMLQSGRCGVYEPQKDGHNSLHVFRDREMAERYYKYGSEEKTIGEYVILPDDAKDVEIHNQRILMETKVMEQVKELDLPEKKLIYFDSGFKNMDDGTISVYSKATVHFNAEEQQ